MSDTTTPLPSEPLQIDLRDTNAAGLAEAIGWTLATASRTCDNRVEVLAAAGASFLVAAGLLHLREAGVTS